MKKIVLFAMACMAMGLWGSLKAQDCNEIVRPYFLINQIDSNEYPEGKLRICFLKSLHEHFPLRKDNLEFP